MAGWGLRISELAGVKYSIQKFVRGPLLFYLAHPLAFGKGVVAGPFKGTRMTVNTTWNNPVYLFVGSYERELHWLWDQFKPAHGRTIWVIGAAEGYYACGIAKKWNAKVAAYEASEASRRVLGMNVRLNGLQEQVQILGKCDASTLAVRIRAGAPALILCDIEGGEYDIFSNDFLILLNKTALVIELHPPYELESITTKLAQTHDVRIINPVRRRLADYPYQDWIPNRVKLRWLDEGRPFHTPWVVALPKG